MDKLKLRTPDLAEANFRKLAAMFPNAVTETITGYTTDENGKEKPIIERAIDADVLRQEISAVVVEGPQERYQFTWPDKKKSVVLANAPIAKTLRLDQSKSVGRDGTRGGIDTENIYIEGDNLDALKLLQETYLGKVKMIYIDPPYNTGNDSFVYDDDRSMSGDNFSDVSGQYDEDGNMLFDMRPNNETNGRFHTDWLNMLYPRLRIAKDLLADDGVIFISIDDNEVENLKKICDEIYGKQNFLTMFCWRTDGNFDNQAKIKICHEYILMYAKRTSEFPAPPVIDPNVPKTSKLYKSEIRNTIIKNGPKNPISEVIIPAGFPCDFPEGTIIAKSVEWPKYNKNITISGSITTHQVVAASGWASKAQLEEYIKSNFKPIVDSKGQSARFVITAVNLRQNGFSSDMKSFVPRRIM